jgi:hypothetical protein
MPDIVNALFCAAILVCTVPAAFAMPHRGMWLARLTVWAIVLWCGWWIACLLYAWASANVLVLLVNLLLLSVLVGRRREIMGLLRAAR